MPDTRVEVLEASADGNRAGGLVVQRNRIPDYKFDGFADAVVAWQIWRAKGLLPYSDGGTGWAEQPAALIDCLFAFDSAYTQFEKQERERQTLKNNRPKRRGR